VLGPIAAHWIRPDHPYLGEPEAKSEEAGGFATAVDAY
jgi:hypothetical protein